MNSIVRTTIVLFLVSVAVVVGEDEGGWSGAAGLLVGNHDNFFFRGPGAAAPSSDMQTVFVNGEWLRENGQGELTVVVGGTVVMVSDIDEADYQIASLGLEYKQGRFKYGGTYALLLNRLFVEEGDPVFFDENAFEGWVRYSVSPNLWLRGKAELAQQDFDPAEDDRDADVLKLYLTARYALTPVLGVRVSVLWNDRDANGPRNDRQGTGFSLGLEGQPSEKTRFSMRVRRREREYQDAPAGDSNFNRDDTVTDVNFNLRWRVRERWGFEIRDEYRDGESTRPDRNFDGNYIGAGLFIEF